MEEGSDQGGHARRQQCQQNKDLTGGFLAGKTLRTYQQDRGLEQKEEKCFREGESLRNAWGYVEGRGQSLTDGPVRGSCFNNMSIEEILPYFASTFCEAAAI